LFAALDADALLVRPCAEADSDDGELFRAAHREATLVAPQPTSFIELRRAGSARTAREIGLGVWGPAETLAAQTEVTLRGLGLEAVREPLDLRAREVAADDLREGSSMVSLLVPPVTLQSESWRSPARALLTWAWLEQRDAEPIEVARELLSDWTAPAINANQLFRSAERATLEQSAVARNELQRLLAGGAGRARVARASNGVFLQLVARTTQGFMVGSFPIASLGPARELQRTEAVELDQCTALLAVGGICALAGAH
jgi:hypothetical protein